jgi:hypothetical protein
MVETGSPSKAAHGVNHRPSNMPEPGPLVRPALFLAVMFLLAGSTCVPPIAFHDGLPAWAPEPGGVEWRLGYQHLSAFGADSFNFLGQPFATPDFSLSYLTPGVRVGLNRAPLAAELGLTSAIRATGGFSALFGAEVGLGYNDPTISVMFRPSLYLLDVYGDAESGAGVDVAPWTQASFLVGNGYHSRGLNFAFGGRASDYGAGPLALIGLNLHPVEFRAELSYMLPVSGYATGRVLTIGLTAAAPTKSDVGSEPDRP